MRDKLLFAAALGLVAVIVTFVHHSLSERPRAILQLDSIFYEETNLKINIPDPKTTVVELYDSYVLIKRTDGLITMVPLDRIHAVDARALP